MFLSYRDHNMNGYRVFDLIQVSHKQTQEGDIKINRVNSRYLDISNTRYLELCPNSNKTLGPFSINSSAVTTRYLELSLSRTFVISNSRYLELSLSRTLVISNFFSGLLTVRDIKS